MKFYGETELTPAFIEALYLMQVDRRIKFRCYVSDDGDSLVLEF